MELLFPMMLILACVPGWVFMAIGAALAVIGYRFRQRTVLRNVCIALFLVIELPFLGWAALNRVGPGRALERNFGKEIVGRHNVIWYRYLHRLIGFEDHDQFWKLRNVSPSMRDQFIMKYGLHLTQDEDLFSQMHPPWWWPTSRSRYSVYEGDDGNQGSIELWIPNEGSSVYLFKFTE